MYVLSDVCSTDGIKAISQAITQAPDESLSPSLRANVTYRTTALYIYTSGTTGKRLHSCYRLSDNIGFTLNTNKPNEMLKKLCLFQKMKLEGKLVFIHLLNLSCFGFRSA